MVAFDFYFLDDGEGDQGIEVEGCGDFGCGTRDIDVCGWWRLGS